MTHFLKPIVQKYYITYCYYYYYYGQVFSLNHIKVRVIEFLIISSTEEIISSNSAMWFSKQGTRLAYASYNDSLVPTMQIPVYGTPGNLAYQYPNIVSIHYPKVRAWFYLFFFYILLSFHSLCLFFIYDNSNFFNKHIVCFFLIRRLV